MGGGHPSIQPLQYFVAIWVFLGLFAQYLDARHLFWVDVTEAGLWEEVTAEADGGDGRPNHLGCVAMGRD